MKAMKKIFSILLCAAMLLSLGAGVVPMASAASVVPYDFAIATNGIFEGTVHSVGSATEKVGGYFLLPSTEANGGFSIVLEMTTNNIFRSQFCITGAAGVIGQYNRSAVKVSGGDENWTITYPGGVFDHHTKQTITLKADQETRGIRTISIPIRDYSAESNTVLNMDYLYIPVVFYDSTVSSSDVVVSVGWGDGYAVGNGGTLEYPSSGAADVVLKANWTLANNSYMSATYQWYKESGGSYQKINGATAQTYLPDGPGNYKVDISITVQDNKLAGVPAGTYNVSSSVTVKKLDINIYLGIDSASGTNVTKEYGDTYRFTGLTHVPGVYTVECGNYRYTIQSTANGNSTYFYTDYITAELDHSGTYNWSFVPTDADYINTVTGTVTLNVVPKKVGVFVSIPENVASAEPETGNITLRADMAGTFKLTTQGITKEFPYSAGEAGENKVIPYSEFFANATEGAAVLEYTFTPVDAANYETVNGTLDYAYATDAVVKIVQVTGGTVTVGDKSDATQILEAGSYTVKVTPDAKTSTNQSSVTDILVNGVALAESQLTRNADGSVTASVTVTKGAVTTVSAVYDCKKLVIKNNPTVYVNAFDSLASINAAIFQAVVDQSKTVGITAADISTLYYQGYMPQIMSTPGYEVWETPDKVVYVAILVENAHTFGEYSANSYKESLKISVTGTDISTTVTVTAYRRTYSNITTSADKILIAQSDYTYDKLIEDIAAKLNGAESSALEYYLADGTSLDSGWNTKTGGDEFTVTVKYPGTANGADSIGSAEKTVTVYIRPQYTADAVEKEYTGSEVDVQIGDFAVKSATGKGIAVTVDSVSLFDANKVALTGLPVNAGDYYAQLEMTDAYGSFTSEYISFKIKTATNTWDTGPAIAGWTYGETENAPKAVAKFGEVQITYRGIANDGTSWSSDTAPTKAGRYTATFTVTGDRNYTGLFEEVLFTVEKKTVDLSGVKWNYTAPIQYDGQWHTVSVDESTLPEGASVTNYTGHNLKDVDQSTAAAAIAYDDNHTGESTLLLQWEIKNDWTPTEYTVTPANGNGWWNTDIQITPASGYQISDSNGDGVWDDRMVLSDEGEGKEVTFYLRNTETGAISLGKTVIYNLDKVNPVGKVSFDDFNSWESLLENINFGLFYKETVTVQTSADDTLSGVDKVEYAQSQTALTLAELQALTAWEAMPAEGVAVTLEDAKQFVYYIRITDKAGNVSYLSTDGAEYDTTAPVIEGVKDGKTYYTTQKVTVSDKNPVSVTLNGEPVTGDITLDGDRKTTYTIVATDEAGNTTTVTVKMKRIETLDDSIEEITEENVTSDDRKTIDKVIDKAEDLMDGDDLTENEKKALEDIRDDAQKLIDKLDEAAQAIDTEAIQKVEDVTADNVTPEDKGDLEDAKADLEKALEDNGGNYTDEEKKDIEDRIKEIEDALDVIDKVDGVEEIIGNLPQTITKEDADAIQVAQDAYDALPDYEKSLVDPAVKKALEDAQTALAELNKSVQPEDNGGNGGKDAPNYWWLWLLLLLILIPVTVVIISKKKKKA